MSIRHAAAFCLALGVTGIASAQPNIRVQTPEAPRTNVQGTNASMGNVDNAHLATCLTICNQAEIEMAKFGEEHTKHDKVKEFAEMLQKDHQAFVEKLSKFAQDGQRTAAATTTTNAADANDRQERREERREERQADRAANGGTAVRAEVAGVNVSTTAPNAGAANNDGHHAHHAVIQLHREITEQCLSDGKKLLEKHKEEGKFDEAFVGMQIGAHAQMKSMLTVFEKHASGELAEVIADGRKTTENHMKKAESLMEELDKEAAQNNNRERRQERREERKE